MRSKTLLSFSLVSLSWANCTESTSSPKSPPTSPEPKTADTQPAAPSADNAAVDAPQEGAAEGVGTLVGRVQFGGDKVPAPEALPMNKECRNVNSNPERVHVRVKDGGLADVFVHIAEGLSKKKWPVPDAPVVIDQKGCTYAPSVFGVQVGQPIEFVNSDGFMHNVHGHVKPEFNIAMPRAGSVRREIKREVVMGKITCDAHPWMLAHVGALKHPFFATSDETGNFRIESVPVGSYQIHYWHPTLGEGTQNVTVKAGEESSLNFRLPPEAK